MFRQSNCELAYLLSYRPIESARGVGGEEEKAAPEAARKLINFADYNQPPPTTSDLKCKLVCCL